MGSGVQIDHVDRGSIALVRLDRPERRNALRVDTFEALCDAFEQIDRDSAVRAIVLTGNGKGFCAGLDLSDPGALSGVADLTPAHRMLLTQEAVVRVVPVMRQVRQPIIAAINGAAVGAGFALALASDIRIAADDAMLQNAFLNVGLSGCDFGVSYLLPRLIGSAAAAEIMLTAERVTAERAAALGLVSRVVPLESLIGEALDVARAIASKSPLGVQQTKRVLDANLGASDLYSAQQLENRTQVAAILGGDFNEAVAAFIERRPPAFSLSEADR